MAHQIFDGDGSYLKLDRSTAAMNSIDYAHHEVHAGDAYSVSTYDIDLDDGDELTLGFTTPNTTTYIHMLPYAENSVKSAARLYEAPTLTGGTDLASYNKNRNSANVSTVLSVSGTVGSVTLNPTVVGGTTIYSTGLGSGKNASGSGMSRDIGEFVLSANTTYALSLSGFADNGVANLHLYWYEHADIL